MNLVRTWDAAEGVQMSKPNLISTPLLVYSTVTQVCDPAHCQVALQLLATDHLKMR